MTEPDPLQLVLVGCSSAKVDEPRPARDLYESNYWAAKRAYASALGDEWRILSAEHAVLDPAREIQPYERHIDDLEDVPAQSDLDLPSGETAVTLLDTFACDVVTEAVAWIDAATADGDRRTVELEVLLGHSYEDPLRARGVFDAIADQAATTVAVRWPFREVDGLHGIGDQLSWLQAAAERAGKTA